MQSITKLHVSNFRSMSLKNAIDIKYRNTKNDI